MKIEPKSSPAGTAEAAPVVIEKIRVTDIVPDPKNRKEHDPAAITVLARSIQQDGLLQPIILRTLTVKVKGANYMLVAGERRWLAHQELKREFINAIVRNDGTEVEAVRRRAAENFHREDLSPIQKAEVLQQLFEQKLTQAEIAEFVGAKDQSTVSNFCRLLKLPPKVKAMVHDGRLSRAHGVTLTRFARWPKVCEVIADEAIDENTPSKDLENDVLPFSYRLENKKLVVGIRTKPYSYENRPAYVVSPALQQDPDFLKDGADWWCFAPEKWAPEKGVQDAAYKAKQKKSEDGNYRQSKLSPEEKAKRQKKVAQNKANRIKAQAQLDAALAKLRSTKALEKPLLQLVAGKVFADSHYRSMLKLAADKLGIVLPAKLLKVSSYYTEIDKSKFALMSEVNLLRLAAGAVALFHGESAFKFAHSECEETTLIAGKYKGAPAVMRTEVRVTGNEGSGFKATAGKVTVSSTHSATGAAKAAAAKYLGCSEAAVSLAAGKGGKYLAERKAGAK